MIGDHEALPDAELVVRSWLAAHPAVTAICSTRISRRMKTTPVYPCLTLRRIGGIPVERRRLDQARIEVQAWGDVDDQETASTLARTARAALHDMAGERIDDAYVTGVDDDLAITWLPDDSRDPTVPRYVFGVAVYLHP